MKSFVFAIAMLIALNLNLHASKTITLGDPLWMNESGLISSLAFHPSSNYIASVSNDDNIIRVRNVATGEVLHSYSDNLSTLEFSDKGNYLVGNSIINCSTWELEGSISGACPTISPDEKLIATINDNSLMHLFIYDLKTRVLQNEINLNTLFPNDTKGNHEHISCLKFSKDGKYLILSGSANMAVWKMDLSNYQVSEISCNGGGIFALSTDGKLIAFSSNNNKYSVEVLNLETNEVVYQVAQDDPNCPSVIYDLKFSYNNKLAICLGYDNTQIQILDLNTKSIDYVINTGCKQFAMSNTNQYFCLASDNLYMYSAPWYITSVNDPSNITTIIYPNPTNDIANIKMNIISNNDINISIYDAQSKLVLSKTYSNLSIGYQNIEINVSGLPNGTYHLQFNNGSVSDNKIVVNR